MATWKNLDTLDSFGELKELKNHVDIAAALSGEEGGRRVVHQWQLVFLTTMQPKK